MKKKKENKNLKKSGQNKNDFCQKAFLQINFQNILFLFSILRKYSQPRNFLRARSWKKVSR